MKVKSFKSLVFGLAIALSSSSVTYAKSHKNLCGTKMKAIQCQGGKGGTGNGFFDPKMNPRWNPNVDPRFNPMADPRFNPMADPRFNPGAKPCDLGIAEPGKVCPKR